ncbi:MAG TPA: hypothetical protein VN636_16215 [Acidimicrobiia bacterium]|nr:hypothetical protein [Acidimicrobiia bacterium]
MVVVTLAVVVALMVLRAGVVFSMALVALAAALAVHTDRVLSDTRTARTALAVFTVVLLNTRHRRRRAGDGRRGRIAVADRR